MTLQLRLTLIYAAHAIAAVAVLGIATYLIAEERIRGNVDRDLEARHQAVEAGMTHVSSPITASDIEVARLSLDRQALEGSVFQVRSPNGEVLLSSEGLGIPLPFTEPGSPTAGFRTIDTQGPDSRSLTQPVVRAGQTLAFIETRTSLNLAEQSLSSIRSVIVFAGLAVAAATGFAAYYVAGRAVRPVTAAAELAREIETTANFARRLPEVRSTREMKDLTETFNKMISRVERMITAQRAFLSDTSHELRRPLAILHTNLAVVGEANLSPDMREAVESEMRAAADTMSSLVAELLVLARSDEMNLKREAVNLSDLCRAMVATARQTAPKHHVETRIADRIWVKGDEQALARVIANVVQNATVYCDDTTSISVELDSDDVEARLCIRDTGPGMSDDDIAHAFDRFYRGAHGRKSRPDGLGLGLAIVKQIIEAHQGRIAIQSSLGVGTAVAIGLPLGAPPDS